MNRIYEDPELEIIVLQSVDIITTSDPDENEGPGTNPWG